MGSTIQISSAKPFIVTIDGHEYLVPAPVGRLLLQLAEESNNLNKQASKAPGRAAAKAKRAG